MTTTPNTHDADGWARLAEITIAGDEALAARRAMAQTFARCQQLSQQWAAYARHEWSQLDEARPVPESARRSMARAEGKARAFAAAAQLIAEALEGLDR